MIFEVDKIPGYYEDDDNFNHVTQGYVWLKKRAKQCGLDDYVSSLESVYNELKLFEDGDPKIQIYSYTKDYVKGLYNKKIKELWDEMSGFDID